MADRAIDTAQSAKQSKWTEKKNEQSFRDLWIITSNIFGSLEFWKEKGKRAGMKQSLKNNS